MGRLLQDTDNANGVVPEKSWRVGSALWDSRNWHILGERRVEAMCKVVSPNVLRELRVSGVFSRRALMAG